MYFIILAPDRPGMLDRRLEHRPRHIAYWNAQGDVLKVAGAMLSSDGEEATPIGSSFLLEAENEAAARALLAQDPFMLEGVFTGDFQIHPVRPAIGAWRQD